MEPIILVHGGAGDIGLNRVPGKLKGVKAAVREGYRLLDGGSSAVEAVEAAVRVLEDDEHFNAGYGSVLHLEGGVQMEASIMDGRDLNVGCVTLLEDMKNPISVARAVMEKTPHCLLGGDGARAFAVQQGFEPVAKESLISAGAREALEEFKRTGYVRTEIDAKGEPGDTVGAVALDKHGNLAAATSTGGMNGKMWGRIGDTPLIGSGTYADNTVGAVSTTGHGESILKCCLAHSIIRDMGEGGAQVSTQQNLEKMSLRLNNTAGAITLSRHGDVGVYFTSKRMAWAYRRRNELHSGIEEGQDVIELL